MTQMICADCTNPDQCTDHDCPLHREEWKSKPCLNTPDFSDIIVPPVPPRATIQPGSFHTSVLDAEVRVVEVSDSVCIHIDEQYLKAVDLREAAAFFTALADILDEGGRVL